MLSEEQLQKWESQLKPFAGGWGSVALDLIAEIRTLREENKMLLLRAEDRKRLTDEIARLRRIEALLRAAPPVAHMNTPGYPTWKKQVDAELSDSTQEEK